jgi:hypothetical protein
VSLCAASVRFKRVNTRVHARDVKSQVSMLVCVDHARDSRDFTHVTHVALRA